MIDNEKDDKKATEEEEFEIVELPEGSEAPPPAAVEKKPAEEDDRLRNSEDDDEDDDEVGVSGETAEQIAERKREARRKRRERQKRAERESKEQIAFLMRQNQELLARQQKIEHGNLQKEARDLDNTMRTAHQRYTRAESLISEGAQGEELAMALRARDRAAEEFNRARSLRERIASTEREMPAATEQRQQPLRPDPRMVAKAKAFAEKHEWLDPEGKKNDDSVIVKGLDIALTQRGLDPTTDEYWEQLEKATRAALPHRFKKAEPRGGPPVAGGTDRATSGKKQFFLSAERKAAMQAAGLWDDPVERQRMLKKYAEHDAQNAKS